MPIVEYQIAPVPAAGLGKIKQLGGVCGPELVGRPELGKGHCILKPESRQGHKWVMGPEIRKGLSGP